MTSRSRDVRASNRSRSSAVSIRCRRAVRSRSRAFWIASRRSWSRNGLVRNSSAPAFEFGIGTVRGVARKLGVYRRQVRQALADAQPPARQQPARRRPVLAGLMPFIEAILTSDRQAPRKQRHTGASDLAADQGGMAGGGGG